jgi:DNA-binding transcriptional LysR family regulator
MELRHLRYFVAIAEERSFTRAAERLWVAQPGLSTQIRRLEAELELRLFDRHTRGVDLTDAGEVFLERARAVLAAAEIARNTGPDLEIGLVGSVRLGLSSEPRWPHACALLDSYARSRPKVEVMLQEAYGGALARDLRDNRLDAMLTPSLFGVGNFRHLELGSEPWKVLVAHPHRLAGSGPLDASALNDEPVVLTGHRDGAGYDEAIRDTLLALGAEPQFVTGGAGPALLKSVQDGVALALTTTEPSGHQGLDARPLTRSAPLSFALFWRSDTPSAALSELIRLADAAVPVTHRPSLRVVAAA